jgi:hypothetical protein
MVARKQLAHIRVNGRLMLPETAIDDYVAKHFVEANGSGSAQPAGHSLSPGSKSHQS